jgi:hypothetical protein
MKLAVRLFAFSLVVAGVAAASIGSSSSRAIASHQSVTAALPTPGCVPGLPGCTQLPPSDNVR